MAADSMVELADRKSRLRARLFTVATLIFIGVQVLTHPVFGAGEYSHGWRLYAWLFNIGLLLLCLGGGGGFANSPGLRALIHDDVARANQKTACSLGFWVAMAVAIGLLAVPALRGLTAIQFGYLVISSSASIALLAFAWLESRAHAGA